MAHLICDHCQHANELTSRYLTFCKSCGRKITNNFSHWSKENPGRSFEDFSHTVARTSIIRWERETAVNEHVEKRNPRLITLVAAALLVGLAVLTGLKHGMELYSGFEDWALRSIQINVSETHLWEASMFREGNFQIKFPASPEIREETVQTAMGDFRSITYLVEPDLGDDDNLSYSASFITYPRELINSSLNNDDQIGQFLDYTIEGLVKRYNGKLAGEKDITYGLFPGREVRMDYQNGLAEIKCRLYLIDNTLYTLNVATVAQHNDNKAREFFLNSFKLLEYASN